MRIHPRLGATLAEVVLALMIAALITVVGITQLHRHLDRLATQDATRSAALLLTRARDQAVTLRTAVGVTVDTAAAALELRSDTGDPPYRLPLGDTYGVALSSTRESVAFDVRGLGYGAANLTLVARRGGAADTLVLSRLGRVR